MYWIWSLCMQKAGFANYRKPLCLNEALGSAVCSSLIQHFDIKILFLPKSAQSHLLSFIHSCDMILLETVRQINIFSACKKSIPACQKSRETCFWDFCSNCYLVSILCVGSKMRFHFWPHQNKIQSNLDISNSDISNSANFEASIWTKNIFWLLSQTIIWRWGLFYKSILPKVQINLHFR